MKKNELKELEMLKAMFEDTGIELTIFQRFALWAMIKYERIMTKWQNS